MDSRERERELHTNRCNEQCHGVYARCIDRVARASMVRVNILAVRDLVCHVTPMTSSGFDIEHVHTSGPRLRSTVAGSVPPAGGTPASFPYKGRPGHSFRRPLRYPLAHSPPWLAALSNGHTLRRRLGPQ
jgi:hypothetical protein